MIYLWDKITGDVISADPEPTQAKANALRLNIQTPSGQTAISHSTFVVYPELAGGRTMLLEIVVCATSTAMDRCNAHHPQKDTAHVWRFMIIHTVLILRKFSQTPGLMISSDAFPTSI